AGETSLAFQLRLGLGALAYLLLEALAAALRLVSGGAQACLPRWRAEPPPSSPPRLEAPEGPDFAKLAAEQARASRERSRCTVPGPLLWHERPTISERGALSYILTPGFERGGAGRRIGVPAAA
ncbi:unnamed protein product, partial [Prorocentrum cordatum]